MVSERFGLQDHPSHARFRFPAEDGQGARFSNPNNGGGGGNSVPMISRIHSDLAASITATAAAELPCTVKLRIWPHNLKNPCASLNTERCLLSVPHAVLCRYGQKTMRLQASNINQYHKFVI